MKMAKKVLAIIVSLCLMLSALAVFANAAGIYNGTPSGDEQLEVVISVDKTTLSPGDTVKVSVMVKNNYNATTMRFPVFFDNKVFKLGTDAETNFQCTLTGNAGANLHPDSTQVALGDGVSPVGYSLDDYDAVILQWVSTAVNKTMTVFNSNSQSVECFSFNLKVLDTLTGPDNITGRIFIPAESNMFYYTAMNDPANALTIYNMDKDTCPTLFYDAKPVVRFIHPEIVIVDDGVTIDYENHFIYGLSEWLDSLDGFVEMNDGYIEYSYTPGNDGVLGNGATVKFKGNDESSLGEFTIVIFGDYNGDGTVNGDDAEYYLQIANYEIFDYMEIPYLNFSLDLNHDEMINADDAELVLRVANYEGIINQQSQETEMFEYY